MKIDGLSILESLRPPPGYSTAAAVGTTYSLDLIAALVALTTLDGSRTDSLEYTKLHALRAIDRLKGKVAIIAQGGRITAPKKTDNNVLALLDELVHSVRVGSHVSSFHPKVWVARYDAPTESSIYRLLVGSRNLTRNGDWDYGIALEGSIDPTEGRRSRLESLDAFVNYVCKLGGIPNIAALLGNVSQVRWLHPSKVSAIEFDYYGLGTKAPLKDDPVFRLKKVQSILMISPFVDRPALRQFHSTYFINAARSIERSRLVAGSEDLQKVSLTEAGRIKALSPYWIIPADASQAAPNEIEDTGNGKADDENIELLDESRMLHAKIVAATNERGYTTLFVGSNNLTRRGLGGGNCEARLKLRGKGLADSLWDWSGKVAQQFEIPESASEEEPDTRPDRAEAMRDLISSGQLQLDDSDEGSLSASPAWNWNGLSGAAIRSSRLSGVGESVAWIPHANMIQLGSCSPEERTSFVCMQLELEGYRLDWVQHCHLSPTLGHDRTPRAIATILGVRGLLALVRESLGLPTSDSDWDSKTKVSRGKSKPHTRINSGLTVEHLLRRLGGDSVSFDIIDKTMERYQGFMIEYASTVDERKLAHELQDLWTAVAEGWAL